MVPDEWIILDGIPCALNIHVLQGVSGQFVVNNVLRRYAQKLSLRDAKKFVQMSRISGTYMRVR